MWIGCLDVWLVILLFVFEWVVSGVCLDFVLLVGAGGG